jgi:hypothetical protein
MPSGAWSVQGAVVAQTAAMLPLLRRPWLWIALAGGTVLGAAVAAAIVLALSGRSGAPAASAGAHGSDGDEHAVGVTDFDSALRFLREEAQPRMEKSMARLAEAGGLPLEERVKAFRKFLPEAEALIAEIDRAMRLVEAEVGPSAPEIAGIRDDVEYARSALTSLRQVLGRAALHGL